METCRPFSVAAGGRARVFAFRVELPRSIGLIPLVKFPVVAIEASPEANFDLLLTEAAKVIATLTIAL